MKKRIFMLLMAFALLAFFTPITAYAATEKEKEPNDTVLDATPMKSGVTYKGTIAGGTYKNKDYVDFYSFKISKKSVVRIYIGDYKQLLADKDQLEFYNKKETHREYNLIRDYNMDSIKKGSNGEYYCEYVFDKADTFYLTMRGWTYGNYTLRVEVFEIPDVLYRTQVQKQGWQDWKKNGDLSGTTSDLRLEAIKIKLENTSASGDIKYHTYIQKIGWEKTWAKNGSMSGTQGQKLRLEAIQIKLTGNISKVVDVYYRTYVEKLGWLGWGKNGTSAGTAGYAYKLEGIEISVVPKGTRPNGYNSKSAFVKKQ